MPYRISIVENAPIECDTPEEAMQLAAALTTGGNMEQMMRDVRLAVISESLIRLGPQYVEAFNELKAQAASAPGELSGAEKEYIAKKIEEVCGGTPLQPNAEFAGGYLGAVVVSMLENWGIIKEQLRALTDKAAVPALQWVVRGREEILTGPDGEALAYVRKTRSKIENFNYADGYVSASTDIAQVKKELEERHAEDSGG